MSNIELFEKQNVDAVAHPSHYTSGDIESKDGTSVKEIVVEWLRENGYDGLCNVDCECGCGIDDLMLCGCDNAYGCVCAYEIPVPENVDCSRFFSTSKEVL